MQIQKIWIIVIVLLACLGVYTWIGQCYTDTTGVQACLLPNNRSYCNSCYQDKDNRWVCSKGELNGYSFEQKENCDRKCY